MNDFDYQGKVWGGSKIRRSPTYLAYLHLKYCLDDLKSVKGRVLDAGCGGGGFAKAVKHYRPDLEVHGVDISRPAIDSAKRDSGGVEFQAGDLYRLPFKDAYFDAVIIEDVLEHLDAPENALREVGRVLKPGGVFHLFAPLEGEWFALHFWLEKFGWEAKGKLAGHIQKFKRSTLKGMLADHGFEVETKRYSGHCLGQLVDVSYYSFLDLRGKKLDTGLEQYLEEGGSKKTLFRLIKDLVTVATNLESLVLFFLPASGVHLLCRKKK